MRSTLLLRLALLAAVLALGAGALAFRGHGGDELPYKSQLNGRTTQGYPVYGVQVDGLMGMVHVVWRARSCTVGRSVRWAVENVDAAFLPFHRDGRAFSIVLRRPGYSLHGSTPHETLAVSGTLSADRRSASGTLRGRVDWTKADRPDGSCDSGPVHWKLAAVG